MTKTAKAFIATVIGAGAVSTALMLTHWRSDDPTRSAVFLLLFLAAATLKCRVPGVTGTYSPVFFFALLGATSLSLPEIWIASALAGVVQTVYKPRFKPSLVKLCFNAASMALSAGAAAVFVQRMVPGMEELPALACLAMGAAAFYLVNTSLLSAVLALTESTSFSSMWRRWSIGCLPYYAVGALLTDAGDPLAQVLAVVIIPSILVGAYYYRSRNEMAAVGSMI